jgi:hypothetical protein
MLGTLIWIAAGLEIGVDGLSAPDNEHGVVAEVDVAVSPRLAGRLFYRFEGYGHAAHDEGSITDVAAGARIDLYERNEPHRVRPFAALVLGDSYIAARPQSAPEYTFHSFVAAASLGTDIAFGSHLGMRTEARLSMSSQGPCCSSPGGSELSAALLFFVGF